MGLGIAYILGALALVVLLLRTRGNRAQNRLLAAWLGLHVVAELALFGMFARTSSWSLAYASNVLWRAQWFAGPFILLAFAGTIETRLARPFGVPIVRRLALVLAAAGMAILLVPRLLFTLEQQSDGSWLGVWRPGAFASALHGGFVAVFAAAVAVDSLLRSPARSLERSRAWTLLFGIGLTVGMVGFQQALMLTLDAIDPAVHRAYMFGPVGSFLLDEGRYVGEIVGLAILVYGVLRVQLFDADLRVKVTLSRGTIAAVFVGVFLVISQLAQGFLSEQYGWALGGLAAALLLLALHPLQRVAERVADTAMPSVRDTPEWRDERKGEVYRTAVRLALSDGVVTRDEEIHLADLATQLGLDARRALDLRHAVERESGIGAP